MKRAQAFAALAALGAALPGAVIAQQAPPQQAPSQQASPQQAPPSAPSLHPMPEDARVYILWPPDGAVIRGGFWLRMGLYGAGVAPAGVEKPHTGHHHLLVDTGLPPLDSEIPNDRNHLHFGLGQTEVRLELPPGRHTLQLLMGDADHVPHNPPLHSRQITVTITP